MARKRAPEEPSGLFLTYRTLAFLGAIVVGIAGGTFALTKLSTSSQVAALQTELDGAKDREKRMEPELQRLRGAVTGVRTLPDTTLAAAGDADVKKLAARIHDLEEERGTLLAELAKRSQDALDPKSELATLLTQLSGDSPDARMDAVRGLFELGDPRAFNSLVAYFRADQDEATRAKSFGKWCQFLFALDDKGGVEFMVQELQSDNYFDAEWAYEILSDEPLSEELLRYATIQLESVALRSPNTVARTRAKLLLQDFRKRLDNL